MSDPIPFPRALQKPILISEEGIKLGRRVTAGAHDSLTPKAPVAPDLGDVEDLKLDRDVNRCITKLTERRLATIGEFARRFFIGRFNLTIAEDDTYLMNRAMQEGYRIVAATIRGGAPGRELVVIVRGAEKLAEMRMRFGVKEEE